MKTGATCSIRRPGFGGAAVAGMAMLTTACASGGRAPPPIGPEAEALFAELTGAWVLDESASSAPTETDPSQVGPRSFTIVKGPGNQGRIIGDVAALSVSPSVREATYEVLWRRPRMLALRLDGLTLVYTPLAGESIEVPMNRGSVTRTVGRESVRTETFWDEDGLGFEHMVGSQGRVRVLLNVVDGRLELTRTLHLAGDVVPPIVLRYDRAEEG